ncbi:hypothetical protein Ddc_12085 [Ditylenchus destructor]|nr:hypothetical protein Ddc_12085 [Ditylenchus destructor]
MDRCKFKRISRGDHPQQFPDAIPHLGKEISNSDDSRQACKSYRQVSNFKLYQTAAILLRLISQILLFESLITRKRFRIRIFAMPLLLSPTIR